MLPELAVGIVLVLTGILSLVSYRWGASDTKKKLLSEKYFFGEKKYQEGYAQALQDLEMPELTLDEANAIAIANLPQPDDEPPKKKTRVVKKFKKGKK